MGRRRAAAAVVAAIAVVFTIVAATQVRFDPFFIDPKWEGTPLPPCFVDASKCYGHVLGSDEVGRDLLARLVFGGMVSLLVPLIAVAVEVMLGAGIAISARAGPYFGFVVRRFEAAISCFPPWAFVIAMIAIGAQRSPTLPLFVLAVLMGLVFSPRIARLARSEHGKRGALAASLDQAVYDLTRLIILLATLDFSRLGTQPPTASWGSMLTNLPENIGIAWWAAVFPALALFSAVLVIEILRRLLFDSATHAVSDAGLSFANVSASRS
ncbi:MAG TPA: hypothetical protein VKT51_07180 [Candidatus Eremiobacteraceae bacterium]|nr:hypothetical protein [Candidatus Eremiobacteraceae bacterium]